MKVCSSPHIGHLTASSSMGCSFIYLMVSSSHSASDLHAGSGKMLGVDVLANSTDLERGYHLGCRSKGVVSHQGAGCTNVLVCILCVVELEFQSFGCCKLPFLVKRR